SVDVAGNDEVVTTINLEMTATRGDLSEASYDNFVNRFLSRLDCRVVLLVRESTTYDEARELLQSLPKRDFRKGNYHSTFIPLIHKAQQRTYYLSNHSYLAYDSLLQTYFNHLWNIGSVILIWTGEQPFAEVFAKENSKWKILSLLADKFQVYELTIPSHDHKFRRTVTVFENLTVTEDTSLDLFRFFQGVHEHWKKLSPFERTLPISIRSRLKSVPAMSRKDTNRPISAFNLVDPVEDTDTLTAALDLASCLVFRKEEGSK